MASGGLAHGELHARPTQESIAQTSNGCSFLFVVFPNCCADDCIGRCRRRCRSLLLAQE